jgi:beta-mannanase
MALNTVVVLGLAGWILRPNTSDPDTIQTLPTISAQNEAQAQKPAPTKEQVMAVPGTRFGVSTPQAPWSSGEIGKVASAAGAQPTMIQFFVKWTQDFRPDSVPQTYKQGALPVISWEPWAGVKAGRSQPTYALSKIADGKFDAYITKFATAVRDQHWPIAIRFAHEMNGNWYPWSEKQSGNKLGDYVKAWRHIHDVFGQVGATNVIWIWSPNIVRPLPNVSLQQLYPGDDYVDWVGMVGYAVEESTASQVFQPTIDVLRKFTQKPLVITEAGVQSGPHQLGWIADFFHWLPQHPEILGFIWFEYSKADGGTSDWRFAAKPATANAFHNAIAGMKLAAPPPH